MTSGVEDLVLDPDNPPPKVYESGATTIVTTWDGSTTTGTKTIAHNLGYTPFALVYIEDTAGGGDRYLVNAALPGILVPFYFTVDGTNLVVTANGIGDFSGTYNLYYYIFYDEI